MDAPRDFDILCVGNANIDTFLHVDEETLHCNLDENTDELRIKHGEKIPVTFSEFLLGGGASNVAVGVTRLGFSAGLVAEIGDDELSLIIRNTLAREGVFRTHLIQTHGAKTSFAVGIDFKRERTLFVQHVPRKHDFSFDDVTAKWIYIGGLGDEWKTAYERAVEFVQKKNVKLAFAPGTKQVNAGLDEIKNVIAKTDILFVNKEEAQRISNFKFLNSNQDSNDQMNQLLKLVKDLGPKMVVITDGERGSWVIDDSGAICHEGASDSMPVEKTGAGDAYASGFLSAIMLGKNIQEAMAWGTKNASFVIQKVGSQPGLLRREEILLSS